MTYKVILYLLLVFILSVVYIFSGAYYLLEIIFTMLSLLLLSFLLMKIHSKSVTVEILQKEDLFYIQYTSKSFFPIGRIDLFCSFDNYFMKARKEIKLQFLIGQKELCIPIDIDSTIGKYKIELQYLKIKDMLGLFEIRLKEKEQFPFILPLVSLKNMNYIQDKVMHYYNHRSDHYDIREFQNHDSIKDIHYKISYKLSKLMVKEKGKTNTRNINILLDLSKSEEDCKEVFTYLYSFLECIRVYQEVCVVAWYSNEILYQKEMHTKEDITSLMKEILSMPKATSFSVLEEYWVISSSGIVGGEKDE